MFIDNFQKWTSAPDGIEPAPTFIFYKHLMPLASFDIHEMPGSSKEMKDFTIPKRWNP
jgi:hypothetical protein